MRMHSSWISNFPKLSNMEWSFQLLPVPIYQITYILMFKNILGKYNPFAFFVLLYYQSDYWLLLLRMNLFHRIVEEEKKYVQICETILTKKLFLSIKLIKY